MPRQPKVTMTNFITSLSFFACRLGLQAEINRSGSEPYFDSGGRGGRYRFSFFAFFYHSAYTLPERLPLPTNTNIAHCILQRKPLGSYTMLPITIGVYFSISYSWMLLLNSFFLQSYYDEKRRSPSSSSSQVEESSLPCTVDHHGPRIRFDHHGPRTMDIRLPPGLRPA